MNFNNILAGFSLSAVRILIVLAITFGSAAAMGQAFEPEGIRDSIINKPVDTENEYMHRFLQQVFGDFIFEFFEGGKGGEQVTILSYALGFTNVLALGLGVLIIFYTFIGGAVNSAYSGEVLGKGWSTVWLPIRTALGFSLILPVAGVGAGVWSIAQMALISIIIASSNAASYLWGKVADRMTSGQSITQAAPMVTSLPTQRIMEMLTCANITLTHDQKNPNFYASYTERVPVGGFSRGAIQLPGASVDGNVYGVRTFSSELASKDIQKIEFGNQGECGSIEFSILTTYEQPYQWDGRGGNRFQDVIYKSGAEYAKNATLTHIDELVDAANALTFGDDGTQFGSLKSMGGPVKLEEEIKKATTGDSEGQRYGRYLDVARYAQASGQRYAMEVANAVTRGSDLDVSEEFSKEVSRGGWAAAGRWFMEISSIQNIGAVIAQRAEEGFGESQPGGCLSSIFRKCHKDKHMEANAGNVGGLWSSEVVSIGGAPGDSPLIDFGQMTGCMADTKCNMELNPQSVLSVALGHRILDILAADGFNPALSQQQSATSISGLADPFKSVSQIGNTLNNAVIIAAGVIKSLEKISSMMEAGANSTEKSIWGKVGGAVGITQGVKIAVAGVLSAIAWAILTLKIMIPALLTAGFVLAFIIPFTPLMIWIMMMIGYIITVVEAIVAAPLAIIQMVTPEGEGISGTRLERAMNLLAMAVLKPSLMIIGLLAAVTIGTVGFGIVNLLFWSTAGMLLQFSPLNFFAIVGLYTLLAYQITMKIATLMADLPDQILDWFSSGVSRSFGENSIGEGVAKRTEERTQMISGLANAAGGAVNPAVGFGKSAMGLGRRPDPGDEDGNRRS